MRVLVPGGTGFIGGAVARALAAAGDDVVVLGRGGRPAPPGATLVAVAREDGAALAAALGALPGGARFDATLDFSAYDRAAVETLLAAPGFEPGRYLLASTGQVCLVGTAPAMPYRESDAAYPVIPEPPRDSPDHPQWSYGVGKRGAEAAVDVARAARGLDAIVLRFPIVLGDGDTSLRTWGYVQRILDGDPLLMPYDGPQPRRFLWVEDIVRAVRKLLAGRTPGPVYHLAQPAAVPVRDIVDAIARAAGRHARLIDVPPRMLELAGIGVTDCSPYSGRWASHLDASLAIRQWGFEATPFEDYIGPVVHAHLARPPGKGHPGYAQRDRERAYMRSIATGRVGT